MGILQPQINQLLIKITIFLYLLLLDRPFVIIL